MCRNTGLSATLDRLQSIRRDKERASGARCRLSGAKRSSREKSRKSGAAVGAFIAYGSAKHLWNNGAAKYIVGEEKRKYLARERTHKIGFYCSLPVVHMHAPYTYMLRSKIDTFSVSIPALAVAPVPAETERKKCISFLRNTYILQISVRILRALLLKDHFYIRIMKSISCSRIRE